MCKLQADNMDLRYTRSLENGQHQETQEKEPLQSVFPPRRWYGGPITGGLDHAVRTTMGESIAVQQRQCLDLLRQHVVRLLLLAFHLLKSRLLGLGSVVFCNPIHDEPVRTTQKAEQPKKIESLERSQQPENDNIRDPAFILLCLPVKLVGANGFELGEE
jgi:hypothetical protein